MLFALSVVSAGWTVFSAARGLGSAPGGAGINCWRAPRHWSVRAGAPAGDRSGIRSPGWRMLRPSAGKSR